VSLRIQAVIVDCHDPRRLASFWAEALGWTISLDEAHESVVEPPADSREDCVVADLLFVRVPETKQVKNRLHLDLRPEDQAAEVARLEGLGATRGDVGKDEVPWQVMADPEGNEFCVLPAYSPEVRAQWRQQYEAFNPSSRDSPRRNAPWGAPWVQGVSATLLTSGVLYASSTAS